MAQETKKSLVDEVLDDALQVRETALANAKLALEEAFEPRIKSMISRHLSEMDDEDMDEERDEMDEERDEMDEERDEDMEETLEDPTNADDATIGEEEDEMEEELDSSDIGSSDNSEPSDDASDTSHTMSEEDEDMEETYEGDDDMDEMMDDEEEDDLDLESVIAELEAELDDEEGEEEMDMDMDSDEEEMDMDMSDDDEDDEIIDLEELLSALSEEEDEEVEEVVEEEMDELAQENTRLASELAEHREAVEILRSKLNEVNLLNAKLLYTTKLFRKYNLNNSQKMKVVESFDRTNSVRETKLVYSTLAESLSIGTQKSNNKRASITEGFASKPTTSTKPKQEIISESNEMADRFKRLISYNK